MDFTEHLEFEKDYGKQLSEINIIKQWCEEQGLVYGDAFTEVDLTKGKMCYWVYASYKDKIANPLETKVIPGLFYNKDKEAAENKVKELKEEGYDVYLKRGAIHAGKCKITEQLLNCSVVNKTNLIAHEGLHNYITHNKIKIPLNLNEAIACFVGNRFAIDFAKEYVPEFLEEAERDYEEYLLYTYFFNRNYQLLQKTYEQNEDRDKIIKQIEAEAKIFYDKIQGILKYTFKQEINNAFFLRHIDYTKNRFIVEAVLSKITIQDYLKDPYKINEKLIKMTSETIK